MKGPESERAGLAQHTEFLTITRGAGYSGRPDWTAQPHTEQPSSPMPRCETLPSADRVLRSGLLSEEARYEELNYENVLARGPDTSEIVGRSMQTHKSEQRSDEERLSLGFIAKDEASPASIRDFPERVDSPSHSRFNSSIVLDNPASVNNSMSASVSMAMDEAKSAAPSRSQVLQPFGRQVTDGSQKDLYMSKSTSTQGQTDSMRVAAMGNTYSTQTGELCRTVTHIRHATPLE